MYVCASYLDGVHHAHAALGRLVQHGARAVLEALVLWCVCDVCWGLYGAVRRKSRRFLCLDTTPPPTPTTIREAVKRAWMRFSLRVTPMSLQKALRISAV